MRITIIIIVLTEFIVNNAFSQSNWTLQNSQIPWGSENITDLLVVDSNNVWASVAYSSAYTKTVDGGLNWTLGYYSQSVDDAFSELASINKDTAWVAVYGKGTGPIYGRGHIYRTCDGGATWEEPDTNVFNNANSFPNNIHFFDKNNGVCCGDQVNGYFEIYTTSNCGNSWSRVDSINIPQPIISYETGLNLVDCVVGNTMWFGTNMGRLYKTIDFGNNWTVSAVFAPNFTIQSIAFKDSLNGIAVASNKQNGNLYFRKTIDGGNTWDTTLYFLASSPWTGWPKAFIYIKSVKGISGKYISCFKETIYSKDDGLTWQQLDTNLHTCFGFYNTQIGWAAGENKIYKLNSGTPLLIENKINDANIDLFPNPSGGIINVEISTNSKSKIDLIIYNSIGEKVYVKAVSSPNNSKYIEKIDISTFPMGIYFLRVNTSEGVKVKKIIYQ